MPNQIAILIQLPGPEEPDDLRALRRLLKRLLRGYGMKCLNIKRPEDTRTFSTPTETNDD